MNSIVFCVSAVLAFAGPAAAAEPTGKVIFADEFRSGRLSPEWQVLEGQWCVEDGALCCRDGGLIALGVAPVGCFAMEFEIAFPSNWMSVIPMFTGPEDYGTLYFGGGYWESFEMTGKEIANYVQRRDPEIVRAGGFQRVRIVSEYGLLSFTYDGKAKGPAALPYRPGARVAFRSLPKSGLLKIKSFRLEQLSADAKIVYRVPTGVLAKGLVYQDYDTAGKPGSADRLPLDAARGEATLTYAFAAVAVFESHFVRVPVDAARCKTIAMDVEGDGSGNNFFIILHDVSGEQHLVLLTGLAWSGWQEVGVSLTTFLESPAKMQWLATHWGGDNTQTLDFPITAIDIGVANRAKRVKDHGQVRFRNVRFLE